MGAFFWPWVYFFFNSGCITDFFYFIPMVPWTLASKILWVLLIFCSSSEISDGLKPTNRQINLWFYCLSLHIACANRVSLVRFPCHVNYQRPTYHWILSLQALQAVSQAMFLWLLRSPLKMIQTVIARAVRCSLHSLSLQNDEKNRPTFRINDNLANLVSLLCLQLVGYIISVLLLNNWQLLDPLPLKQTLSFGMLVFFCMFNWRNSLHFQTSMSSLPW